MLGRKQHSPAECPACIEKNRTIALLMDQIEWLRMHSGTPKWVNDQQLPAPVMVEQPREEQAEEPQTFSTETSPWMSEEEQDIRWAEANGQLTSADAVAALRRLGVLSD